MKRAFIFANGRMENPPSIVRDVLPTDLIIAADGGTHHCRSLGIMPSAIIGDFDSLQPNEINEYKAAGVEMIQFPSHKNETDLELALRLVLQKSVEQVFIIGALGARWDMTLANILLLAQPSFAGLQISLYDGSQELHLLHPGDEVDIAGHSGETLSLIPLCAEVHGITTHGLEYSLTDETLYFGSPRGVSNVFLQDHAQIRIRAGMLLCILNRRVK